jgi:hypothetical protein
MTTRKNAIDQQLDVNGSLNQNSSRTLTDETNMFGEPVTGQDGYSASIDSIASGIVTISGLTGMTDSSIGRFITIAGAATAANNGTFLITAVNSATSVDYSNPSGVAPDANNGSIEWTEREPYSLEDDLNFVRTDRALIKGVAFDADIPVYQRPTAVGTDVPANLSNIAGKTTDAQALIVNRKEEDVPAQDGYTSFTLTGVGLYKHADATDRTGIPIFDGADAGDNNATYVEFSDGYESELLVLSGPNQGNRIFGRARAGASTSPDSFEIELRSVPRGEPLSSSVPYTWEAGQPDSVDVFYPYRERLDMLDENALRTTLINGLIGDQSAEDVNNLLQVVGVGSGSTDLSVVLTNLTNFFPFSDLPDATPSVVEALNTLNEQIGDRDYTGSILTDGYTITASLQQLADAIANQTAVTRTIERLTAAVPRNTEHPLPAGLSYTIDGTNNGQNMWVFWRGILRDPGPVVDDNDYEETSSTSITPYTRIRNRDHINYFILD